MLRRTNGRAGFTVIELIVVMAIIAVLVSLILSAVMMVRGKGPDADTSARIDTLSASITKFNNDQSLGNPKYIPAGQVDMNAYILVNGVPDPTKPNPNFGKVIGPFRLESSYPRVSAVNPDRNALDENCFEAQYIAARWNQADLQNLVGKNTSGGNNPPISARLNANQTVVFFLGGIQSDDGQGGIRFDGFSHDRKYPFKPLVGTEDRKRFIEQQDKKRYEVGPGGYAQLIDGWNNPLAYFSAYNGKPGTMSGWNPYPGNPAPYSIGGKYLNESGFQIISPGKDGKFGPGGAWTADQSGPGRDDRSNFSSAQLGAGPPN